MVEHYSYKFQSLFSKDLGIERRAHCRLWIMVYYKRLIDDEKVLYFFRQEHFMEL